MSDITINVKFDYSPDLGNTPPSYPFVAHGSNVNTIDVNDQQAMKDFSKSIGWFSLWGKDVDGIDTSQVGGNALLGDWVFFRKKVGFNDVSSLHPVPLINEIEAKGTVDKSRQNSPIFVCVYVDGVQLAFIVHRNKPGDMDFQKLFGTNPKHNAVFGMKNALIPYPQNATWVNHPSYQKGKPVHNISLYKNKVNVMIDISVGSEFTLGWLAVNNSFGGSAVSPFDALDTPQSSPLFDPQLNATIKNTYPTDALAKMLGWMQSMSYQTFDAPGIKGIKSRNRNSYATSTSSPYANMPISPISSELVGNYNPNSSGEMPEFTPPDELVLPDLQGGAQWFTNVRGVLILKKNGQMLWPHEVFDLENMRKKLRTINNALETVMKASKKALVEEDKRILETQIERVEKLFEYQEQVGESIALNARIFRS
jgi:hypothetical protein